MKLTIDFETRSQTDIKKSGAWVYSEDPLTDVICLVIKQDDKPPKVWLPNWVEEILGKDMLEVLAFGTELISDDELGYLASAEMIEAHNAEFEQAIWKNVMVKKYGFEEIEIERWRCSAAKTSSHSLPRSLDGGCSALNLPTQKDQEGYTLMLKMCKPRKPIKKDLSTWIEGTILWHEKPDQIIRLIEYCVTDVNAEHGLSNELEDLNPSEQKLWFLDQKINQRGISVDTESINAIMEMVEEYKKELTDKAQEITGIRASQVGKLLEWMNDKGAGMKNLQKETVVKVLERGELAPEVEEVLKIRQKIGMSSVAKLPAMLKTTCGDGTIKGSLMFHGAGTGRWAGKMFQPHNLPRKGYDDIENALDLIKAKNYDVLKMLFDDPMQVASHCVRAVLRAKEGNTFYCSDFSSIEARVLVWLAGDDKAVTRYESGRDMYKIAAAGIYEVGVKEVTTFQRLVGKVTILACGYQGGWKALSAMCKAYGLAPPEGIVLEEEDYKEYGRQLNEKDARMKKWATPIVDGFRADNPLIRELWDACGQAIKDAVSRPGEVIDRVDIKNRENWKLRPYYFKNVKFAVNGRFLQIQLPSGRLLSYYSPTLEETKTPWGSTETVHFWGVDSITKKWVKKTTYGGKIVENIVQAIARDLLKEAMFRAEAKGYPIVFHVHDEIVSEVPVGFGSLKQFDSIMSEVPLWANGCPIGAEGFISKRYKKG